MNISVTQLRRDGAVLKELELIRQEETQQTYKGFDQRDSEIMWLFRGSDKYVVIRYSLAPNIVVMMDKIPNSTNMVF